MTKISDVCEIINGFPCKRGNYSEDREGNIPIIRIQNMNDTGDNYIYYSGKYDRNCLVEKNTILVSLSGTIKVYLWNREKALLNQRIVKVLPGEKMIHKYIYYLLISQINNLKRKGKTSIINNVSVNDLKNISVKEISLEEQQKVVNELDKINECIENRKKVLEDYNKLVDSKFYELFGDVTRNSKDLPLKKWNEVLTIKNGRNQKQVESEEGEYPIYGSGGIIGYANDYICKENTIIIGRKGNINRPLFVKEKFWNVDTAFGLEAGLEILPVYLYKFCDYFNFEQYNKAVTIPSLTKVDLLKIDMPIPKMNEQKKFEDYYNKIESQKALVQKDIEDLEMLLESKIHKYFK